MRTINSVKNPKWADPTGFRVDMDVDFDELDEIYVPFTAYKFDNEAHSVELFERALLGEFGEIAPYTPPPDITGDDALETMREERTRKLEETDYVENPTYWSRLSEEKQSAWTAYRNALRDITDTVQNPVYQCIVEIDSEDPTDFTKTYQENFQWPEKPA